MFLHCKKNLILIMFSFTLDIYCTSARPGRGIPHMWLSLRFLLSFYLFKGFFRSFSLLLLRVKGRGCHTLLKPYETNCGLWIWAIQIKFDWLIDPAVSPYYSLYKLIHESTEFNIGANYSQSECRDMVKGVKIHIMMSCPHFAHFFYSLL